MRLVPSSVFKSWVQAHPTGCPGNIEHRVLKNLHVILLQPAWLRCGLAACETNCERALWPSMPLYKDLPGVARGSPPLRARGSLGAETSDSAPGKLHIEMRVGDLKGTKIVINPISERRLHARCVVVEADEGKDCEGLAEHI